MSEPPPATPTTLCWIDAELPEGWVCEIRGSDGRVRRWNPDRPVGPNVQYRVFDPDRPHGERDVGWRRTGDYLDGSVVASVAKADVEFLRAAFRSK